ncbi:hypothetical protein TQ33_1081 [Kangiella geojedonensis]|uniref:Probable membrane transporter protein n=2 Tax=Kangiella geojedonensis TaxID=914150 RepID=A0A0F6RCG9_9GAMM|nr:hypothetical protein TQ33_1081 [Kangiella geojedonensis]
MDLMTIILIAFVVFVTGVSKSGFAGALGVFAVPLLMLKLPATQAIALMLPILIIADIFSVKSYWMKWDSKLLYSLIPGAVMGILIAHAVVSYVSISHLKIVIAATCIIFSLKGLILGNSKWTLLSSKAGSLFMSSLSGFSSTLVHAGGPPLMMYLSAKGFSPKKFIATASVFFAAMNVFKLLGFSVLGILTLSEFTTALPFLPFALWGNQFGVFLQVRVNKVTFLRLINALLLLIGLYTFCSS